jgi:hypothetical protein
LTTAPETQVREQAAAQPAASLRLAPEAARDVRARPANRRGEYVETDEFVRFAQRIARALGQRIKVGDPETLALVAELVGTLKSAEIGAAQALNAQGFSWTEIGRAQGIAGQTAADKYAAQYVAGRPAHAGSRKSAPTTLWRDIHAATGLKVRTRKGRGGRVFTVTDPGRATFPSAAEKLAAWLAENGWTVTGTGEREAYAEDRPA